MLLKNIDQATELCNVTRLIVDNLGKNFIGVSVITKKMLVKSNYSNTELSSRWSWTAFQIYYETDPIGCAFCNDNK